MVVNVLPELVNVVVRMGIVALPSNVDEATIFNCPLEVVVGVCVCTGFSIVVCIDGDVGGGASEGVGAQLATLENESCPGEGINRVNTDDVEEHSAWSRSRPPSQLELPSLFMAGMPVAGSTRKAALVEAEFVGGMVLVKVLMEGLVLVMVPHKVDC